MDRSKRKGFVACLPREAGSEGDRLNVSDYVCVCVCVRHTLLADGG